MKQLSNELLRLIETMEPRLRHMSEADSAKPILSGGWSMRQVVGHLIDSASNNHQRFVRAALQESLEFPEYTIRKDVSECKRCKTQIGNCWFRYGLLTTAIWPT